jgi:nucleoid-associated protein YgaU
MPRIPHGGQVTVSQLRRARAALDATAVASEFAFAVVEPVDLNAFDYLFPTLQLDPDALLPAGPDTNDLLKQLGRAMRDPSGPAADDPAGDAAIPAAYTYFGQFIDHDITLEAGGSGGMAVLLDPGMVPMGLQEVRDALRNARTATLELDSLYGLPAPRDPANTDKLLLGPNASTSPPGPGRPFDLPPGTSPLDNDLPREPRAPEPEHDRAALIGDPRNDENLVVAQLHVAFLKAHNALVDLGYDFESARRILRQHYQYLVVHDFLRRVADPAVVDEVLHGNRWFDAYAQPFFMPLEFAVAAFRFGHTMVRDNYDFNVNFNRDGNGPSATLGFLFTFTALSGELGDFDTVPENWIIQWENFVDTQAPATSRTRQLNTQLAEPGLSTLRQIDGAPEQPADAASLAVRNLLRGHRLRIPTGQAVARLLGLEPMEPDEIEAAAATDEQRAVLGDERVQLSERTPLWYYILAEAQHHGQGQRLGPVGSTIIAEVLIGLVRRSEDSFLKVPGWAPSLPVAGERFELADLLRFAGVLGDAPGPQTVTVQPGDTLFGIAERDLGQGGRWPEIFVLNRAVVRDPALIAPGQVLVLPAAPMQPPPRLYRIAPGDTLFGIAERDLDEGGRWPDIFALNREVISDPRLIPVGLWIVLPSA